MSLLPSLPPSFPPSPPPSSPTLRTSTEAKALLLGILDPHLLQELVHTNGGREREGGREDEEGGRGDEILERVV